MIYLDSAATSLQKPATVTQAVQAAMTHMASPGRGGHRPAMLAAETAFGCRQCAAELFHVSAPEQVIFTFNATHALNLAIKTLASPGSEIVISGYEHNAVTRPLAALDCRIKIASSALFQPDELLSNFEELISSETCCVVCTHVSNVFGYIMPLKELGELCRRKHVPLIVDASQSAGCLPVHMDELRCTYAAMPGHKGLYGPQGIGLLLCGDGAEPWPLLHGGTGSLSASQNMPDFLPDRLEAGTPNIPGIAGLWAGLRYVMKRGTGHILQHEQELIRRLDQRLQEFPQITSYGSGDKNQSGVLSFRVQGWDCEELGEELGSRGIAVRAGLHCAPLAHQTAGTAEGGTVRISVSAFNTSSEMERFIRVLQEIVS